MMCSLIPVKNAAEEGCLIPASVWRIPRGLDEGPARDGNNFLLLSLNQERILRRQISSVVLHD